MIDAVRVCLRELATTVGRGRLAGLLLLQVGVAALEGAGLLMLVPVFAALGGEDRLAVPGVPFTFGIAAAFATVVVVVLLRAIGQWWAAVLAVEVRLATVDRLRLDLVDDLHRADWRWLHAQRRSHLLGNLTTDVERAQVAVALLLRLVVGSSVLVVTAAVGVAVAPVVGGLAVLVVGLVVLAAARSTGGAGRLGRQMTARMAGLNAALSDALAAARVMRAHGAENAWSGLVRGEAARVREVRRRFVVRSTAISAALGAAGVLAVLGLVLLGREVGLSAAELAALVVIAMRLLTQAQGLVGAGQGFANDFPALARLRELHDDVRRHPERVASVADGADLRGSDVTGGLVELRGVGLGSEDAPVLSAVDLAVGPGEVVALTGASGVGKSTVLEVVLGLLVPDRGELLVDGRPIGDLGAWRARLGYVPQHSALVPGTVRENLAWSLQPGRELDDDAAWRALTGAALADVVRRLPDGIDTVLDESAALSGGEQQRLCIARALVREPQLLVLDEATSALDRTTEEVVLDRLLDGTRAVLMVTHREPSDRVTRVVRLDRG